jgi:multidrug efflux pump subunit AcrA (membrane-fusion protein)
MISHEIEMSDDLAEVQPSPEQNSDPDGEPEAASEEIAKLRDEFQARIVIASLRTEAVRAGMIDLDGLKMVDVSSVRLGNDDRIIGGRKLMDDLRRNKPWLFGATSSSSAAVAPASQPVRNKTALEMTDDEYTAARAAVTKYHF